MIRASDFKIRCSAIGQIMTESRGKTKAEKLEAVSFLIGETEGKILAAKSGSKTLENLLAKKDKLEAEKAEIIALPDVPELSQTAKTFCEKWLKERLYERRRNFETKETRKGNMVEDDAIAFAIRVLGWDFAVKNEAPAENAYMKGTCDVNLPDFIADTKCSFDEFTFPLFEKSIPEDGYEWQLFGYMILYRKNKAKLVYCLMDTPDEIIEREAKWKLAPDYTREDYDAFFARHKYGDVNDELRIRYFDIEADAETLSKIQSQIEARVAQCRSYIQTLIDGLPNFEK